MINILQGNPVASARYQLIVTNRLIQQDTHIHANNRLLLLTTTPCFSNVLLGEVPYSHEFDKSTDISDFVRNVFFINNQHYSKLTCTSTRE